MKSKAKETKINGKKKRAKIWELFFAFFKIGIFTIGGGMAMIPLIERLVVEKKKWLSEEEMIDCLAISQSLPGVVAINTATYIGNKRYGAIGAICATLGVIAPSFISILAMMCLLREVGENEYLSGAFEGVKAGVCGLLILTTYKMSRKVLKGVVPAIIGGLTLVLVGVLKISVIIVIGMAMIAGLVYNMMKLKREKG